MTGEITRVDEDPALSAIQAQQPALVPLASPSCREVCTALAAAQGEFEVPKRTKEATVKGQTRTGASYDYKYKYAPLEEIISAVKDALAKHGLFRQQYLVTRGNVPVIRTIIWHTSGEWIASDYPVHQSKDGAQGFAAGVTYARRYGLSLALGLAPEDDDDATENAKIEDASKRREPPRIGPNVMNPPGSDFAPGEAASPSGSAHEHVSSEGGAAPDNFDRLEKVDAELAEAAKRGTAELEKVWKRLSPGERVVLKAALDRRHKPAAMAADNPGGPR